MSDRTAVYPFVSRPGQGALEVARTEGVWLVRPDGSRILDAAGGAILVNVGHGRSEVAEAMAAAAAEATFVVPPFATPSRLALAERLRASWLPAGIERMVFTCGGSESVDLALRVARQHHVSAGRPGRWKVVGRELSYHGATLSTLAVGGHLARRRGMEPLLVDHPRAPACYPLRCAACRGEGGCTLACADAVEAVIEREGPDTVAAVIAEPVVGSTAGALVPPDGYWPRLREICDRHGVLLVADEVMSGFGRTGRAFAVDHFGVLPDILVGGKGLAGGYAPMGGVYARPGVVEPIAARGDEVMFYTYGAHPASCAAADKVLEIMEREGLVARAAELGAHLAARLATLADHPNVAETRGRGLLQAVELVRDRETLAPFPPEARIAGRVVMAGLRRGVFFYPGGTSPGPAVVCLGPPFVIDKAELDLAVDVLRESIDDAVRAAERRA